METSKTPAQAEILEYSSPITSTTAAPPLAPEGAPVKGTPEEASAETAPEGNGLPGSATPEPPTEPVQGQQGSQDTVAAPPPGQEALKRPGEPPSTPATVGPSERGIQPGSPAMLVRAGWRVAEVGLGLLLIGLIVAVVWTRRRG
jgi:hypothetical protein